MLRGVVRHSPLKIPEDIRAASLSLRVNLFYFLASLGFDALVFRASPMGLLPREGTSRRVRTRLQRRMILRLVPSSRGISCDLGIPGHACAHRLRGRRQKRRFRRGRGASSAERSARAGVACQFQHVEDPSRFSGQAARGLGDIFAGLPDQADGEAPEQRGIRRAVAGADAASVLVEGHVEDVVVGLDPPVPAIEGQQSFGCRHVRAQAGDAIGRLAGLFSALDPEGFPVDCEDLARAGKVDGVVEFAGDPDRAFLLAPVVGLAVGLDVVRRTAGHCLVEA